MGCKWTIAELAGLGRIVTGKTPPTKHQEYYGGDTPFLTPSDDLDGKYLPKTSRTLSLLGLDYAKRNVVPRGSISMSCIGSHLGKVVINTEDVVTNQQINTIIPNTELVDRHFLYYTLIPLGQRLNSLSKTSTAVPIVNKSQFSECEVFLPNLKIQKAIAKILSSLDSKIELNNQINDYLAA